MMTWRSIGWKSGAPLHRCEASRRTSTRVGRIQTFRDRPTKDFGGLVPIFAQWVDNGFRARDWHSNGEVLINMAKLLRPDVGYITVSQHDKGVIHSLAGVADKVGFAVLQEAKKALSNVLIMSAGGAGHIPLPLLKQPMVLQARPPLDNPKQVITAFGKIDKSRPMRSKVSTHHSHPPMPAAHMTSCLTCPCCACAASFSAEARNGPTTTS